jgi:Glycosyl hydrolases family 16
MVGESLLSDTADWNALAAQVMSNHEATGQWFVSAEPSAPVPGANSAAPLTPADSLTAPPGFKVVLADDFSEGYNKANWGDPFPLPFPDGPSANGAYVWDPNAVGVSDGQMQISMTHEADGTWHTSGFNSFKAGISITYGQVDFDAQVDAGHGTTAAIMMWPSTDTFPPEIDILETPNNQGLFTLHWADSNGNPQYSQVSAPSFDPSEWHHYSMTWLPTGVSISVDGHVMAQWDHDIPAVPMSFGAMGFVGSPADGWMGGAPDATTPNVVTAHLDNVVMSQWEGIA